VEKITIVCNHGRVDLLIGIKEEVLAQPTRARIYRHLADLRSATSTEEIAQALSLHPNGVRRHLERLSASGLVERRRHKGHRGRPSDRWALTAKAPGGVQPSAYADLANWLARAVDNGSIAQADIERTGFEIGQELAPEGVTDAAEAFSDLLSSLGFQPEFEFKADGSFCCTLMNCPYRESARGHQQVVCTLHRGITSGLLSKVDPGATLDDFQPRDPDQAGCLIGITVAS
jgi:predicted ArsR family transcriptional regulator